jgi:ribonuclease BN (tRNA processing enzyme)
MRLTVLGGDGGWPTPGGACSGYLVEGAGFRLLIDPGYAVMPRLLLLMGAAEVDAVLVTHGHPDHCADLNPLLRARTLSGMPAPALPVYALPKALDPVFALDRPTMLGDSYRLREFAAGDRLAIGPFELQTRLLPHPRPNAGLRISAGLATLVYGGDCGPSDAFIDLARGADVLLAESSYATEVPTELIGSLSSARDAGRQAAAAGVRTLILTHLVPGEDRTAARRAARAVFRGHLRVARPGLSLIVA